MLMQMSVSVVYRGYAPTLEFYSVQPSLRKILLARGLHLAYSGCLFTFVSSEFSEVAL